MTIQIDCMDKPALIILAKGGITSEVCNRRV